MKIGCAMLGPSSFPQPIFAKLFDDEDGEGYSLIWSRSSTSRGE